MHLDDYLGMDLDFRLRFDVFGRLMQNSACTALDQVTSFITVVHRPCFCKKEVE
jgi:hypothetical protein